MYNHEFDLSGLRSDLSHKVRGDRKDFIDFNVCGNIIRTCDNKTGVAGCYTKNGVEQIIGERTNSIDLFL